MRNGWGSPEPRCAGSLDGHHRGATGSRRTRPLWLISRCAFDRVVALTADYGDGEETLPVFSFEEEAETFLRLEADPETGWQVRESAVGEVASMLCGPCAGVGRVALDPLPASCSRAAANLVSMDRERFVWNLVTSEREKGARMRESREDGHERMEDDCPPARRGG